MQMLFFDISPLGLKLTLGSFICIINQTCVDINRESHGVNTEVESQ